MEEPASKKRKIKCKLTDLEKKERERMQKRLRDSSRVTIKDEFGRWRDLKEKLLLKTDAAIAKVLLDRYIETDHDTTTVRTEPSATDLPNQQSRLMCTEVCLGGNSTKIGDVRFEYIGMCTTQIMDLRRQNASTSNYVTPVKNRYVESIDDETDTASEIEMEEDNLQLDCESVIDDSKQRSNDIFENSDRQANSGTTGRDRIMCTVGQPTTNQEGVEFQSIHGLPVNVPFTLQYLSPCARKTLKSRMYIIVEQRVLSYTPVTSVNIKVQGDICEHVSDSTSSFMKDINDQKMSSWVEIANIIKKVVVDTNTSQIKSTNKLEKHDQTLKADQSDSTSDRKIEELYPTLKTCLSKNPDQAMNIGLIMDTDEIEKEVESEKTDNATNMDDTKVAVGELLDSFGVSNVPDSFGMSNVPDSFGVSNVPDSFGVSNVPDSFGVSNVPDSFGVSNVPDSFGVSNVPDSFGVSNVPDSFGMSNVPDNFGVSNMPIDIKQESQDLDYELAQESQSIGTNMENIGVTDIVRGVLDSIIANVVEQCKAKLDNLPKANINKVTPKRKSDEISYNVYEKKKKFLKVEETANTCQSERQSSRLRSKGYRIDYGQFDDLKDISDISDLDDIFSDSEGADDEDDNSAFQQKPRNCSFKQAAVTRFSLKSDDIFSDTEGVDTCDEVASVDKNIEETSDGSKKEVTSVQKKKHKKLRNNIEEDPDFYLCEAEAVDEDHDSDLDKNNDKRAGKKSISVKKKKVGGRRRYDANQILERLEKQKNRIRVTLSEHTDKYTVEEHVSFEMKDRGKKDSDKTIKLLVCSQCKKFRTENEEQMENHIEQHLNGELTCKECNFHATYSREMVLHNQTQHKGVSAIGRCPICDLICKDKLEYRDHLSTVHNLSHIICKVCLKADIQISFGSHDELTEHFVEQHRNLIRQCFECGKYFRDHNLLRNHQCSAKSKEQTKVPCEICGKKLSTMTLKAHKARVHFNLRPHACPHCNYAATYPSCLQKHINARHKGVHPYQCDQCAFSCVRHSQLVSHKRTHSGDKPYKCDMCPYSAAWKVQLKDHQKLHGSHLAVKCEQCDIVVRKGAAYTKHLRKEHGETAADDS